MARFRYVGIDSRGRRVTGERDATDPDALTAAIAGEVRFIERIQQLDAASEVTAIPDDLGGLRLSRSETTEISQHIAEIVEAGMPLESGLAAIAEELPGGKLGNALRKMVRQLESGANLETVLNDQGAPAYMRAMVRAGLRTGRTGELLEHYAINSQGVTDLRQAIRMALAYPLVLLLFSALIVAGVTLWALPQFQSIVEGFDLELPWITRIALGMSRFLREHGGVFLLATLGALCAIWLLVRLALGEVALRRLVCLIPIVGPILRWNALARFAPLLALLVESRVPLKDALVLAADASGDAEIRADCQRLAASVEAGETLEQAAHKAGRFPASFVHALSWEQRGAGFAEVLNSLADMYAGRARTAIAMIMALFPPLFLFGIGLFLGFMIVALFFPLFDLLNKIS